MKKARTWLVLLAIAASVAGCSDTEQAKKEFFANGERFLKEKKYQEAIVEFRNAIQQDEKYGEARLKLGDAYAAAGNPQGAYREYVRAADLLPLNNDAQIKAATFLLLGGQVRRRALPHPARCRPGSHQRRRTAPPRERARRAQGPRRSREGD